MTNQAEVRTRKAHADEALLAELIAHDLLIPCGVPGVYGRGGAFEDVIARFGELVSHATREDAASHLHFPPAINRAYMERAEYLESFPHLAGLIFSFQGDDARHLELVERVRKGEPYGELTEITAVALTPAACHALYPTCRGRLPERGKLVDLTSYCFRHEPSGDPARMQMFRMREHVKLGKPEAVHDWRDLWIERGRILLESLGLSVNDAAANDPFFGRGGRMLAANQRQQALKFELVTPITSAELPTAVMSFNYHQDHFATLYGIETHDGAVAHSACLGFGLERIAIALFKTHGFDLAAWPEAVRQRLGFAAERKERS